MGQADGACRALGEIEHAAANEGATIVDRHDDAAAAMGDAELGAERQRAMSCGHGVLVEALARRGAGAGFIAVIGGDAGEGTAGAHRCIGVQPGILLGVMLVMMVMLLVMAVMPGFGGRLAEAAAESQCRGEQGDRGPRSAQALQRRFSLTH